MQNLTSILTRTLACSWLALTGCSDQAGHNAPPQSNTGGTTQTGGTLTAGKLGSDDAGETCSGLDQNCTNPSQTDAGATNPSARDAGTLDASSPVAKLELGETHEVCSNSWEANGHISFGPGYGVNYDRHSLLHVDADDNFIISGSYLGTVHFDHTILANVGTFDAFLAKVDSQCQVIWARSFGGLLGQVFVENSASDSEGNLYVATYLQGLVDLGTGPLGNESVIDGRGVVIKLAPTGNVIWAIPFGETPRDGVSPAITSNLAVDSQGNVVVVGSVNSSIDFGAGPIEKSSPDTGTAPNQQGFIVKLAPDGQVLWQHPLLISASRTFSHHRAQVKITTDDTIIVASTSSIRTPTIGTSPPSMTGGPYLAKFSSAGDTLWLRGTSQSSANSYYETRFSELEATTTNDIIVARTDTHFNVLPPPDGGLDNVVDAGTVFERRLPARRLSRYDARGNLSWTRSYENILGINGWPVLATGPENSIVLGGTFRDSLSLNGSVDSVGTELQSRGNGDVFVLKLDGEGSPRWWVPLGDEDYDFIGGIDVDSTGHVVALYSNYRISPDGSEKVGPSYLKLVRLAP